MSQRHKPKTEPKAEQALIRIYSGHNLLHYTHVPKGLPDHVTLNLLIGDLQKRETELYNEHMKKKLNEEKKV